MKNLKVVLDVVTTLAIITVCALLAYTLLHNRQPSPATSASLKGMQLPVLTEYDWNANPRTLALAIRKGCHFCEESLPFYEHLSELQAEHKLRAHILVITPDEAAVAQEMLRTARINADSATGEQLDQLHVTGTPTIMLVDTHGRIQQAWIGKQTPKGEEQIIQAAEIAGQ